MKYIYTCVILLSGIGLFSQNLSQYSMNSINPYLLNPAAAGMTYSMEFMVGHRSQWIRNTTAPNNYFVTATAPLINASSSVGMMFESRSVGLEDYTRLGMSYGYVVSVFSGVLSISGRATASNLRFDGSELISSTGNYENNIINHNDPSLPIESVQDWSFGFDGGLWYQNSRLRIGIGATNIYSRGFFLFESARIKPNAIYSASSSYRFVINNNLTLTSGFLIKTDLSIVQSQINSYLSVNNNFTTGLSLIGYDNVSIEEIGLTVGYRINNFFNIFYTYGLGLNAINNNQGGSHEIILNFDLGKPIGKMFIPRVKYNTRFLE